MAVDVKDLVEYWHSQGKIRKFNDRVSDIQICCPRPHYRYDEKSGIMAEHYERRPSLGISVESGVFNCLACGFKGRIEALNAEIMGMDIYESIKFLSERYDFDADGERVIEKEAKKLSDYDDKLPKKSALKEFDDEYYAPFVENGCDYFEGRGYKKSILAKYQFGYDRLQKRAVFPIRNESGKIVGMVGRDVTDESKVKFMVYNYDRNLEIEGWDKGLVVHFSKPRKNDKVFVVESGQDVPWGDQIGMTEYTDVASILGSKITERQVEILSGYSEVVLGLDNDYAGEKGTERAIEMFQGRTKVSVAKYPDGKKDLGDCNSDEAYDMFQSRETPTTALVKGLKMITD